MPVYRFSLLFAVTLCVAACSAGPDATDREMRAAISQSDLAAIGSLLSRGYPPDRKMDRMGWTPLTTAAAEHRTAVVQFLLEHGAAVDAWKNSARAASQRTALSFAAGNNDVAIAQLLLSHDANPNARDVSGQTPLHRAAMASSTDVLRLLLESGANVNERDNLRATPLIYASHGEGPAALACVRALLEHGADVSARTKVGEDALDGRETQWCISSCVRSQSHPTATEVATCPPWDRPGGSLGSSKRLGS